VFKLDMSSLEEPAITESEARHAEKELAAEVRRSKMEVA